MLSDEELALLDAIRDTGSLSRAAARLGKAPSTVSHAARQLETRFDALLFDRSKYRLQLTPAGHLLAEEASRLMLDMARMTRRVRQVASGWEDRLWIVADELLEFETVMPVIRAFDGLKSGVRLRLTHEVLSGTWEALRDGRADLIAGATNEPPAIPGLRWFELGVVEWVFAVAPRHPLAAETEPLRRERIAAHRAVVVGDSARMTAGRAYGIVGGQDSLALPSMHAKILAQREGLGVGWLPRHRVATLLARGELVEKATVDPREPNVLYVAWRSEHEGRALQWWIEHRSVCVMTVYSREQHVRPFRCRNKCHKVGNILNVMPKSQHGKAKAALGEIWNAATRADAIIAFNRFVDTYAAKYPKAVEKLVKDRDDLLAFDSFPAEHWQHVRTTNPIESTFATVRHRKSRTRNCLSRATFLSMAFKLIEAAEQSWRKIRGVDKIEALLKGIPFEDGTPVIESTSAPQALAA